MFEEPWQAHVFALVLALHEQGAFTWAEWAQTLSAEIGQAGPAPSDGYYGCWLSAAETLVTRKEMADQAELLARKAAWAEAFRTTPHGRPVELQPLQHAGPSA